MARGKGERKSRARQWWRCAGTAVQCSSGALADRRQSTVEMLEGTVESGDEVKVDLIEGKLRFVTIEPEVAEK